MLYAEAEEHRLASEMTALRGLRESYPEMEAEELLRLNNQVLIMITEYHLMSASQGSHSIPPVLPEGAARLMPPLDEYLPGSFDGCRNVRVTDRAQILRVAAWLHRLDLSTMYGAEIAASPRVQDYDIGLLLEYFLMPKLTDLTLEEVTLRVAQENRKDMEASLRDLHDERDAPEWDRAADQCSGTRAIKRKKEIYQEAARYPEKGTPFEPGAHLPVGGAPGFGATSVSGFPRRYH